MRREWAALLFAMIYPSVMTWIYFVTLAGGSERNPALLAAYGAGKVVQFAFPALYVWRFDRQQLRLTTPNGRGVWLGLGFGLGVALGMFALYYGVLREVFLTTETAERIYQKLREFGIETPARFLLFAAFLSLGHSLLEEYYWRWFVFGRLRSLTAFPAAVVVSSLAFMAHHVIVLSAYFPGPAQFLAAVVPLSLCVAAGGGVWAWLYERTRSFYAPWLSHLLVDAALMAVAYDLMAARYWG